MGRKKKSSFKLFGPFIVVALIGSFFLGKYEKQFTRQVKSVTQNVDVASVKASLSKAFLKTKATIRSTNKDDLSIASFNIRILSDKSRDDEELRKIAKIIQKYDLVAVQEVRDEIVLSRLIALLEREGKNYEYDVSPSVGRGVKEKYAFLYDTDKVERKVKGRLYDDVNDDFIREPYYATFKSGEFDFTLLTIHLLFGNSKKHRRPELLHLARVYQDVQDEDEDEQDVILLGDFNFAPDDKGWDRLKQSSTMRHLLKHPTKTTIQDSSLYDNFWFQDSYVQEYTGVSGVHKFDETMFNDDKVALRQVSDHRPVWAKFRVTEDDD